MKFQELTILLPCHSLEDFPIYPVGEEAQGLLAGWSAIWHPALIAAAQSGPAWGRIDYPPEQLQDRLLVVPSAGAGQLPAGYPQRVAAEGGYLILRKHDRNEIVQLALSQLEGGSRAVDPDVAADFHALGYCYLQVLLLTRRMRYTSNLDEKCFFQHVVAAATSAVAGDHAEARQSLQASFDLLAQERSHYYSVDAFVLDLTLVAQTTLGKALRDELAVASPANLLLSAGLLSRLASTEPETLAAIRQGLHDQTIGLIGGELVERRIPLLGCETILAELRRASAQYNEVLGQEPGVFGRHRFGLSPALPQLLHKRGFRGCWHATFEDGKFPQASQAKIRWEGTDGSTIDALGRPPLDGSKPETYLAYATKLAESMDTDHVATISLAHWPGGASPWRDELRRIAKYGSILGRFVTVDEYFRETSQPVHGDRFPADQYRSPYLLQAVIRQHVDPISSCVRYWRRRAKAEAIEALRMLVALLVGSDRDVEVTQRLVDAVDMHADEGDGSDLDRQLDEELSRSTNCLVNSLPRRDAPERPGLLVANLCSFSRRTICDVSLLERLPVAEAPVVACDESAERKHAVVEVPPLGFAWLHASPKPVPRPRRQPPPLAEDRREREGVLALRNEFFEATIHPVTGSLQSIHTHRARGNRISQRLALRTPGGPGAAPDDNAVYSVMVADEVRVSLASQAIGRVTTHGRLLDRDGRKQAGFRQTYELMRGSRVLRLTIELEPIAEPQANPWSSYYACRFAWADEGAELSRTVNQTRQVVEAQRFEAPNYVEISDGERRTTVLTGGLPFHRRSELSVLDTLLITRGERARTFELGIGIDLTHPMHEALAFLAPDVHWLHTSRPPLPADSAWLFHLDNKNLIATHWSPRSAGGRVCGFRTRILETSGRRAQGRLACFRSVASARQVDFRGTSLGDCRVEEGQIILDLGANEWIELEATW